jgi:hypothetical protein
MRTGLIAFTLLLFSCFTGVAQKSSYELTDQDWDNIIGYLSQEKWNKAESVTHKLLEKFSDTDTLADPAILRYMYLRCVAAQLGEKKYSKETALKKVKGLVGKPIITPPLEFKTDRIFNGLQLAEDSLSWYSCASNNTMTVIQCFEYYSFEDSDIVKNSALYNGKKLRIGAYIKEIEAEGYSMPRFRVVFEKSFIWSEE